ncbi:MAG: cellulase N-terminal Ig-like domain-containing protein, partial [Limisphaerales bacterium]
YNDLLTRELYTNDVQAVFTLLFGSWLGDFDAKDNIMRGVLALPSYGLTCAWSGRPHWFMHHMALGMPIGFSARLTQNNGPTGLYQNEQNSAAGQIHIALMGDPTLRMHVVAPPSNLTASTNGGSITLNWAPSSDSALGYHVYRAAGTNGSFARLTTAPIQGTSYVDAGAPASANYMVRAVKLETSASGTYYNASQGAFLGAVAESAGSVAGTGNGNSQTGNTSGTNITAWVDDALPAGAVAGADGGDSWNWVSSNPAPASGSVASQSNIGAGLHEHYFSWATQTLSVGAGDVLYAYVYLDPNNVPSEVMLQWDDNSWEHRAYWGANNITYGASGTPGRVYMGPLPAAGQWALLQVPASQVGLEGSTVHGIAFSQFDGRATWDNSGKASSLVVNNPPPTNAPPSSTGDTNSAPGGGTTSPPVVSTNSPGTISSNAAPGISVVDYVTLELPKVGDTTLHILTPSLLELKLINTKAADPAQVAQWNLVNSIGQFTAPSPGAFVVTANGRQVGVISVGFKRRPLYAPMAGYDLRIENSLYLQLSSPISDGAAVEVKNPDGSLWASSMKFAASADPLRYSPAIHVNQEGYMPNYSKKAMVGFYGGSMGEVSIPASAGFTLVDAATGAQVYQGSLAPRKDSGYTYTPA